MIRIIPALILAAGMCLVMLLEYNHARAEVYPGEKEAIQHISNDMQAARSKLAGKRIGIFNFTAITGEDTPDGARLSASLLESLMKAGGLVFIERAQVDKLLKAQGLEQTGVVDTEDMRESGKILPIDVVISGTLSRTGDNAELQVRAADIQSGEIYAVTSASFSASPAMGLKENPGLSKLQKDSPGSIDAINRAYTVLLKAADERPGLFFAAVLSDAELKAIAVKNPRRAENIIKRREAFFADKPEAKKKIQRLEKGLNLMKEHDRARYDEIMKKKEELLDRKGLNR
jgi:hypothetical protein